MTEIARMWATVSADTSKLEKSLHGVKTDLTATEKGFVSFQNVVNTGFKAMGIAAAAAFAGLATGLGAAIKAAASMEQGVADIGAVMSLTATETARLQDHILDLGLDPNLKVSATEASDAIMSLGTAGLSMTQIMGGASKATVLLSNATGGDMANSAALMTDVMAQYGIAAEDTSRIVDQMTGLTVASKFAFDDVALAFGQVGGVAGSLGLSLEDTNAILGTTAYNFNSGSDAATSMKTFLQRLIPTTNDAKEAMLQLGLSTGDDVIPAFFHANGMMRSAEEIAGNLSAAFAGLSDAQRNEAASTIFGTDAMRTALALVEGGTPSITKFKDEVAKVDAGEMASKRMNTFAGAVEIAQGVVETISISIGNQFLPVLRPLVERFTELAQVQGPKLIAFFGQFAERMAGLIQQGMDWMQRVLVPLWDRFTQIGKAINIMTGIVMQALRPVTDIINKWVKWQDVLAAVALLLGGAVLASIAGFVAALSPVILLVAKVAAALALMRAAWNENFLGIRDIAQNVLNGISKWLIEHTSIWQGTWNKTLKHLVNNGDTAWRQLYEDIEHWFSVAFNEAKHIILTWIDVTERKINGWIMNTENDISSWVTQFIWAVRRWQDDMRERFSWFFTFWDKHVDPWVQRGKEIVQGFWDGMKQKWILFTDWFKGKWNELVNNFKTFFGIHSPSTLFASYGSDMMEGLQRGIDAGANLVFDSMDKMVGGIAGKLDEIPGLIDRSNAVVAMEAFQAKLKFLEEASKSIGPYWLQPGYTPPPSTMPPVLKDPNYVPGVNTGPVSPAMPPRMPSPMEAWYNSNFGEALLQKFGGGQTYIDKLQQLVEPMIRAIKLSGPVQGSSELYAAMQRLMSSNLYKQTVGTVMTDAQMILDAVRASDPFTDTAAEDQLMKRNNELLLILIQELRNKNLTSNVLINSNGSGLSELVQHTSGLRL